MNTVETKSFRDYLTLARRFKWRALACLAGAMALAVLWVLFAPREYSSEAKLFVRIGRENASLDPTVTKSETITLSINREEEINSIVEHLRSRAVLEKLLASYEPSSSQAPPEVRDRRLRSLQRDIYVGSPKLSTVITIQANASSPERAQELVSTLIKVYLEEHMRINSSNGSYEFFRAQSELLKKQLDAAQATLRDAKDKAGLASVEGRRAALEGQISALEMQIQQVVAQQSASAAKLKALEGSVSSLPQPLLRQMLGGMPNDGLATMENQLFELRIREQEALAKYTPEHPRAVAIREQVKEVEESLRRQTPQREQIVSALTATASADLTSLTVQKEKLQGQLDQLSGQLVAMNDAQVQIEQRSRDVRELETQYLAYSGKREEARMDQSLKADRITNVSILQPATFEPKSVSPRKAATLFLGLVGGLLAAILVVLLSEQFSGAVGSKEPVEATGTSEGSFVVIRPKHSESNVSPGNETPAFSESKYVTP